MTLDADVRALLDAMPGGPDTSELSVAEVRAMVQLPTPTGPPTAVSTVEELTVLGAAGPIPARLYRPARYRPAADGFAPTLVFFHGGGWVLGDLDTHDELCGRLCAGSDAAVVSVPIALPRSTSSPLPSMTASPSQVEAPWWTWAPASQALAARRR